MHRPPGKPPADREPDRFAPLRALVDELRLSGNEAATVVAICDGNGRATITDRGVKFEWSNPLDNWNSTRKRLNRKFKGRGLRFFTHDNRAAAEPLVATGRK